MQDAPEMLPLYERTGSVKDVNSEFGESDKQSDLCPAVLQFDLDEEDFDQVEGHSTASGSNSDKDIDQDRQFGQELFKEDKRIVRVEDELEMQVSANGGSVGHEIRPDESKQDAEYEYEPELIPEEGIYIHIHMHVYTRRTLVTCICCLQGREGMQIYVNARKWNNTNF